MSEKAGTKAVIIRGLTYEEVEAIKQLAEEKEFDSMNDFLLNELHEILAKPDAIETQFVLHESLKEIVTTNHELLKKADQILRTRRELLRQVVDLKETYANHLINREGDDFNE